MNVPPAPPLLFVLPLPPPAPVQVTLKVVALVVVLGVVNVPEEVKSCDLRAPALPLAALVTRPSMPMVILAAV